VRQKASGICWWGAESERDYIVVAIARSIEKGPADPAWPGFVDYCSIFLGRVASLSARKIVLRKRLHESWNQRPEPWPCRCSEIGGFPYTLKPSNPFPEFKAGFWAPFVARRFGSSTLLENFSFCHHLAVAALPEEAAFCLLRDADAFEPRLVLLSGLSSETSYRVQPLLECYWRVDLPRDYKKPRLKTLSPTDQGWPDCRIMYKSGGVVERTGPRKTGPDGEGRKADAKRNHLLNPDAAGGSRSS